MPVQPPRISPYLARFLISGEPDDFLLGFLGRTAAVRQANIHLHIFTPNESRATCLQNMHGLSKNNSPFPSLC